MQVSKNMVIPQNDSAILNDLEDDDSLEDFT
jgi:hypothetical protein